MSGTRPPFTRAISLATVICTGALSSPKNWVAALPGMLGFRPRGAWVAYTRAQAVLAGLGRQRQRTAGRHGGAIRRREVLRLVHHQQATQWSVACRIALDPCEQRHLQLADETLTLLVVLESDHADHRHAGAVPGDGSSDPRIGRGAVPSEQGIVHHGRAPGSAPSSAARSPALVITLTPSGRSASAARNPARWVTADVRTTAGSRGALPASGWPWGSYPRCRAWGSIAAKADSTASPYSSWSSTTLAKSGSG